MSLEETPSRSPISAQKPRPAVPSRTTSLKYLCPSHTDGKRNFTTTFSSAKAKASGEIPASSCGPVRSNTGLQGLIVKDGAAGFVNKQPLINMKRSSSSASSSRISRRSTVCNTTIRNPMRPARVKRWSGLTRTETDWDGLRRDPELWFEDGDCLVHLYARGQSRRGPSFCVPFRALRQRNCGGMFSLCFAQVSPTSGTQSSRRVSFGSAAAASSTNTCELYIPAPEEMSREDSFKWHITTRNFFAYIFGMPLVGTSLGQTLIDLQERLHLFRSGQINNFTDFLQYAEKQGYRDLVDCPDYALAFLFYAEHYQLRDVWIDAFVHTVGMNDSLCLSEEFKLISRITKALITRAYLDMDIHLGRVMVALSNFLEDGLSSTLLGLSLGARTHLDQFRSFLHSFYVEKFGYWPPPKGAPFSKALYQSMYFDIRNVYEYLVDRESTLDIASQKLATGGICVLQNVKAFDKRHNFLSLPHPVPLLPQYESQNRKTSSQKGLRTLTLGSKQAKTDRYLTSRAALTAATNTRDISVISSPLVKAYMRFERQCALNHQRGEKVSMADSRKVRWLLIYGILQYLVSALRAPKEVQEADEAVYPLCCLVPEQPPWEVGTKVLTAPAIPSVEVPLEAVTDILSNSISSDPCSLMSTPITQSTIQPDCETDGDYFTHTNQDAPLQTRPMSVEVPAPLRISAPIRNSSIRSFGRLSFTGKNSRRNSASAAPQATAPFVEPRSEEESPSQPLSRWSSIYDSKRSSKSVLPDGAGPDTSWLRTVTPEPNLRPSKLELNTNIFGSQARTPILDSYQMDQLVSPVHSEAPNFPNSSDSGSSKDGSMWSDASSCTSSKSSTHNDSPSSKLYVLGDKNPLRGSVQIESAPSPNVKRSSRSSSISTPTRHADFRFSFDKAQSNEFHNLVSYSHSASSSIDDSLIGVALSAPPPPMASMSVDALPLNTGKENPFARSFSTEYLVPAPKADLKSIPPFADRSPPSAPNTKEKESVLDIFSALSLGPSQYKSANEDTSTGHAGSEMSRDVQLAVTVSAKQVEHIEAKAKKERRKSFGFSLRRR
ncbi:hypothetical protein P154DRAFT_480233 [Amniculicola lignicola CBS 123094]|uniref:DUF8004 domain-containing protein n=1 Tax=Amniculicola lignicola CBS 123094 TaxID=1392246 RepID=A0A6A5X3E7_9PLEO|nr:hypothetical protein P154DRAFT_480233 [Amniculicola lignicola CBS 123094]